MSESYENDRSIESKITDYISKELVSDPGSLFIGTETPLLEPHIIDSLSLLKLVLYLEKEFGITVGQDELVPDNFATIKTICSYLSKKSAK